MASIKKSPSKRRRRKKKSHYHRGLYTSTRSSQQYKYRSGWELKYMQFLDNNMNVVSWEYESVKIPYVSNVRTGKIRTYYPDFFVKYDNCIELVEIKPKSRLKQLKVKKKLEAAELWCRNNGVTLKVITEIEMVGLGLI